MKAKYIRVSTTDQSLERQSNVENDVKLYADQVSGLIPFNERPSGKRLLRDIEDGKINYVIIHSVDRLGRCSISMQKQLNMFIENNIQIFVENLGMELMKDGKLNNIAKMIVDLLGSVAALEMEALKESTQAGIARAKLNGVYKGRQVGAVMTTEDILTRHKDIVGMLKDNMSLNKVSKYTGKSFRTCKKVQSILTLSAHSN